MAQEIEAKVLNIDVKVIEKKLAKLGAKKEGDKLFSSITFDYPGFTLDKQGGLDSSSNERFQEYVGL
ncbi:MAG: hypothetical protein WCT02_03760 [Candidatus Paceibacterota bacterium]